MRTDSTKDTTKTTGSPYGHLGQIAAGDVAGVVVDIEVAGVGAAAAAATADVKEERLAATEAGSFPDLDELGNEPDSGVGSHLHHYVRDSCRQHCYQDRHLTVHYAGATGMC